MNMQMRMMIVAALAASVACAQDGAGPGWNPGGGPPAESGLAGKARRGGEDHGARMSPELRAQMKADHEAIRDLAGAIRLETDEAKKAELVAQLRAKLGAVADRMQTAQEERLAQAEARLAGLKEKIAYAKENREKLLDEQVQRVLSGERPQRFDRFKDFPHAKGGRGGPDAGMAPPPGEEGPGGLPPPPEMDMPGEMPPPPAE